MRWEKKRVSSASDHCLHRSLRPKDWMNGSELDEYHWFERASGCHKEGSMGTDNNDMK